MKQHLLRISVLFGICASTFIMGMRAQTLVVPPSPGNLVAAGIAHLTQSNDYTVEVKKSGDANYTSCFVYKTDNYASNLWGGEHKPQTAASFVNFSFDGTSVDVRITVKTFTANSVTLRPLSYGINPVQNGNVITFTLNTQRKISVEVNDRLNPLFIFADKPDVPNTGATYYYGPGIHKIGLHKELKTGDRVYIAGGAVVQGTFYLPTGTNNVEVRGRGIITGGNLPTAAERTNGLDSIQKYAVFTGHKTKFTATVHYNLSFEGFMMVNTCGTHFAMVNYNHTNHDNTFRNLKEVDWSVNTDNVFDGDNNIVDDCFFFINDDLTVLRSGNNLKVTNCVMWNFLGRLFWTAGYGTSMGALWENIDVIGKDKGPDFMLISSGSSGSMKNYTFRNIRVESHTIGYGYSTNKFLNLSTGTTKIENWLFENITLNDKNADEGDIIGNATGTIDVTFRNLKMAGSYVTSLAQANMNANSYATVNFQVTPEINVKEGATSIADNTGSYNFGSVVSGSSITKTFTIENTGPGTLNLTGSPRVTVTGTGFSRIVDAAASVSSGGTTSFQIRFAPTSAATFNGTISIANNDSNENPYNFAITGTGTSPVNLVTNPTFDVNTTGWLTSFNSPGAGTIASVTKTGYSGKACKVTVTNAGPSAWGVQVRQNIPITSGKTYSLTFKASADAARTIGFAFQKGTSPYTTWWMQSVINLTTSVASYGPYTFDCTTTDGSNLLCFLTGGSLTDVYIDDVVITETSSLKSETIIADVLNVSYDEAENDVKVYPNPVAEILNISVPASTNAHVAIRIVDMQGRVIASKNFSAKTEGINTFEFDVQDISSGTYLVKINTAGFIKSKMIVIKH